MSDEKPDTVLEDSSVLCDRGEGLVLAGAGDRETPCTKGGQGHVRGADGQPISARPEVKLPTWGGSRTAPRMGPLVLMGLPRAAESLHKRIQASVGPGGAIF